MHLLMLLFLLFVIQPLIEYWLHRLVHRVHLTYHAEHHRHWSGGKYWRYTGDWAARAAIAACALAGWHTTALMLLKYELVHSAIHIYPGFRYLHRHHFLHHRNADCNFTFSAIWPDRLFGTASG